MAWDKNDYIAAALIITIIVVSILIAAALMGYIPGIKTVIPFID